jgi:uncharacterized protein (TIGR02145 family)
MQNKLLLFVVSAVLFWTCKKNDATVQEAPAPKVITTITGIVTNETGQFLQGVSVTVGDKSVFTDKEGLFLFENIEVPENRYYIKATLNNYFESGSGGIAVKDGVTTLLIKLMSMGTPKDVSATAASTNAIGGTTLKFDAGSFVNQNGNPLTSGTVRVYARSLNPGNTNFSEMVPGGDLNSTMPDGSPATLVSYGMVGVELRDANNNELKLANGKQAEIRFPIASSQLSTAPAEIPLLSMDPETGVWKQEGVATKVGSEYVGKVGHFSWWNCDVSMFNCRIRGRVVDCDGKPLAGIMVLVNGQYTRITDVNGYYSGMVPRIPLRFEIKIFGNMQNLSSPVFLNNPLSGLNTITDIRVGVCPNYVTGSLNRCGSDKNFYIRALWGQNMNEGWVPTLVQGNAFTLSIPSGKSIIIRLSTGTFTKDTLIAAQPNNAPTLNLGQLSGCVNLPTVKTAVISNAAETSAISGGEVVSNGGAPITARGVVWSTSPNPILSLTTKTSNGTGIGIFTSTITGLIKDVKYYVRAYATNSLGTGYGNQVVFTAGLDSNIFNPNLDYGLVTDIDGNTYKTIQIGTQVWMAENLRVTKYRNGVTIPQVSDSLQWSVIYNSNFKSNAWCYLNNNPNNNIPYGKLYNFYAALNSNNICPLGWHIPSSSEFNQLINFLGGNTIASNKIKSTGSKYWPSPNLDANNESGFSALPGASRNPMGNFVTIYGGNWWSSTQTSTIGALFLFLGYNSITNLNGNDKAAGLSVRCIKD